MYCYRCGAELQESARYCIRCGAPALPRRAGAATEATPGQARSGWLRLGLALLGAAFAIACGVVGYLIGWLMDALVPGVDLTLAMVAGTAVGGALALAALGGSSLLRVRPGSLGTALRRGWWVLFVSLVLAIYSTLGLVYANGPVLVEGWFVRALDTLALCACIGVAEESMFRGLVLGGLLAALGKDRRGVCAAVIVSSVLFGTAHIEWLTLDYADPISLAQALLKVVQTGILGFFLATTTLRTGSIVGPAILHGLSNYLLLVSSVVLTGIEPRAEYVLSGAEAAAAIALYSMVILLYLPLAFGGARMLREVSAPDRGAFMR